MTWGESPNTPAPGESEGARIGVDEWVATHEARTEHARGFVGGVQRAFARVPPVGQIGLFAVCAACIPLLTSNGYVIRVGFDTLLYMLLAVGLNVVVGFAGLLDLGYMAFYGLGAYGYAMLASPKFGVHLATPAAVVATVAAAVIVGFLVSLPSRRLVGDYLAIVTLFFGQLFVTLFNNGNHISLFGLSRAVDATGGPNGIANIDPFHIEGHQLTSLRGYFWVALTAFAVVIVGLHLVSASRTGRAWRALREDPYAAELLGMPVNRLKLVAFAFGAGVAGLTGTLFAALNSAVFTADFDVPLLITVYAMVVLGGTGSLKGVAVGAIVVNVTLEVLRTPGHATWVFYGLVVITIAARVRPRRWAATVLGGLVGLGFAVHAIVAAEWPSWAQRPTGAAGTLLRHWILVVGPNQAKVGNYAFILLVVAVIALLELKGRARTLALIPLAYLAAFAWENRLVVEPSVTRLIFLGVLLILLMNARPQGLLGTARVEIA